MTLRRQTAANPPAFDDVDLRGATVTFDPQDMVGDVRQGDKRVVVLPDEINASGWPAPPQPRDIVETDGKQYVVQGADARYDGETLAGYVLWVRG